MTRCPRCGTPFERHTADQRYCALCLRELADRARPAVQPVYHWRHDDKDWTGRVRQGVLA